MLSIALLSVMLIALPLVWISGYWGYRDQSPMTPGMKAWLAICGLAIAYAITAQVTVAADLVDGTARTVVVFCAAGCVFLVMFWFIAGTRRGKPHIRGGRRRPTNPRPPNLN
jgi:hypothetical protein